jgi:hypothetical protein
VAVEDPEAVQAPHRLPEYQVPPTQEAVEEVLEIMPEVAAQEDLALSSSRSTNKDIHAKQSLSILWN